MADLQKLREQIAAGEYRLDAASIAGALLDYASVGETSPATDQGARRARITASTPEPATER